MPAFLLPALGTTLINTFSSELILSFLFSNTLFSYKTPHQDGDKNVGASLYYFLFYIAVMLTSSSFLSQQLHYLLLLLSFFLFKPTTSSSSGLCDHQTNLFSSSDTVAVVGQVHALEKHPPLSLYMLPPHADGDKM